MDFLQTLLWARAVDLALAPTPSSDTGVGSVCACVCVGVCVCVWVCVGVCGGVGVCSVCSVRLFVFLIACCVCVTNALSVGAADIEGAADNVAASDILT